MYWVLIRHPLPVCVKRSLHLVRVHHWSLKLKLTSDNQGNGPCTLAENWFSFTPAVDKSLTEILSAILSLWLKQAAHILNAWPADKTESIYKGSHSGRRINKTNLSQ